MNFKKQLLLILCIINVATAYSQTYLGNPKDTIILNRLIDSVNNTPTTYTACKNTIYKAKALVHKSDNLFFADILLQEGHIYFESGNFGKAAIIWDSAGEMYVKVQGKRI